MQMTNEEIVRRFKEAKDKKKQVGILAELNMCEKYQIIEILKASGIDHRNLPRTRKNPNPEAIQEPLPVEEVTPPANRDEELHVRPKQKAKEFQRQQWQQQELETVTPRKDYEAARIRELTRGISTFVSQMKPINPEWVVEYNELLERRIGQ